MNNIDRDIQSKLENIDLSKLTVNEPQSPLKKNSDKDNTIKDISTPKKNSEADERPKSKNVVDDTLSAKSVRQQMFDQHLNDTQKSKADEPLGVSHFEIENLKNDIKIEINNDIQWHIDGIKEYLREELEQRNKDFNVMRRNNVDEVLRNVEAKKYPISGEIERAIIKIIGSNLERSLSAPSRMHVKSTQHVITSGFEQSRNELTVTATQADMTKPILNDFKPLFSNDAQKVNDFVK